LPEKQETIEGALPFSLSLIDQRLSGGSGDEAERLLLSQTRGVPLTAEAAEKNEGGDSRREREKEKNRVSRLCLSLRTHLSSEEQGIGKKTIDSLSSRSSVRSSPSHFFSPLSRSAARVSCCLCSGKKERENTQESGENGNSF
jgi:hypothetical protein